MNFNAPTMSGRFSTPPPPSYNPMPCYFPYGDELLAIMRDEDPSPSLADCRKMMRVMAQVIHAQSRALSLAEQQLQRVSIPFRLFP